MEQASGGLVVIVPVETDPIQNALRIPPAFPGRPVMAKLLSEESFVVLLLRAHALNVNYRGAEGVFHFIVENQARSADWNEMEDSLLAHEFGHIWLNAIGYRSPQSDTTDAPAACLAAHTGDIVQHILIRDEAQRRGVDVMRFWLHVQEMALTLPESQTAPQLDRCQKWQAAAEWLDAVLGAPQWPLLDRYQTKMRAYYPVLIPFITQIREWIEPLNLWDRSIYEYAMQKLTRVLLTIP